MMSHKIFLIAGPALLAILLATGLIFYFSDEKPESGLESHISSLPPNQISPESPVTTTSTDDLPNQTFSARNVMAPSIDLSAIDSSQAGADVYQASSAVGANQTYHRGAESISPLLEQANDAIQHQMPLIFLDYANVLPPTEEAAAAIQKLQQDFVDSTGAATANPADPDYADRWDQFQVTADDRFYAIFGVEAFNSLSITEARQRGGF